MEKCLLRVLRILHTKHGRNALLPIHGAVPGNLTKESGRLIFMSKFFEPGALYWAKLVMPLASPKDIYWQESMIRQNRQPKRLWKSLNDVGQSIYMGWNHLVLGEVALEKDLSQASPHLEKCITIFKEIKAENMLAKAYAALGRLYKKQGDVAQAREYLTKALEIFTRLGTLIEPDKVKKELADLPAD